MKPAAEAASSKRTRRHIAEHADVKPRRKAHASHGEGGDTPARNVNASAAGPSILGAMEPLCHGLQASSGGRRGEFLKPKPGPKASRFRNGNNHDDAREHLPDVHHQGPAKALGSVRETGAACAHHRNAVRAAGQSRTRNPQRRPSCCSTSVEDTSRGGLLYYGWTIGDGRSSSAGRRRRRAAAGHLLVRRQVRRAGEALERAIALDNIDLMGTEPTSSTRRRCPSSRASPSAPGRSGPVPELR